MPPARAPRRKGGWLSLLLVGATASWLIFLRTRQLGARRGPATPPPPPPAPEALPAPPPPTPPPTRGPPVLRCSTTRGPFAVELDPALCPNSAAQLSALASSGFLSQGLAFWRVNRWITQFAADQSPEGRRKAGRDDPFAAVRRAPHGDRHPSCPPPPPPAATGREDVAPDPCASEAAKAARARAPWPRGTLAVIGSTALLVVRAANSQMGTAPHDCPVGRVLGDGMETVFDKLHDGYGNTIDTQSGISQRDLFKEGLDLVRREYPQLDILEHCELEEP